MKNRRSLLIAAAAAVSACAVAPLWCPKAALAQAPPAGQPPRAQRPPWAAWQPPQVVLPQPNAFDTYLKAFALMDDVNRAYGHSRQAQRAAQAPWWDEGPQELTPAERVKAYAGVYKLAREALGQECRLPTPTKYDVKCPYLADFRAMARLFAMESSVRADNGDMAGAASSALDCIQMAQQVETSRWVLGALVGWACEAMGVRALDDVLPLLDARECGEAGRRLAAIEAKRVPLGEIFAGEEVFCRASLKQLMENPEEIGVLLPKVTPKDRAALAEARWADAWRALDDYWSALQKQTARPYRDRADVLVAWDPLLRFMEPGSIRTIWLREAVARTAVALREAQLAARRFTLDKGRLPATLDDLVPAYLPAAPADPFGATPPKAGGRPGAGSAPLKLQARPGLDEVRIYSVGPDGRDDEGARIDERIDPRTIGDIVVKVQLGLAR